MGDSYLTSRAHQNERTPPENPATPGMPHDGIFAEKGAHFNSV